MHWTRMSRGVVLCVVLLSGACLCVLNKHLLSLDAVKEANLQEYVDTSTGSHGKQKHPSGRVFERRRLQDEAEYFHLLKKPSGFRCRKLLSLGGASCRKAVDGDKHLCMDPYIQPPVNGCLVYSFGISSDVSFEVTLNQVFTCETYMFDPTRLAAWLLMEDLPDNIHFDYRGVDVANKVLVGLLQKNLTEVYSTFDDILRMNGHLGRTIHYLKMDIEGSEWEVLEYMMDKGLLNNVLQLAVEIHSDYVKTKPTSLWLAEFQKMHDILARLEEIGFRRISYRENTNPAGTLTLPSEDRERPACGEIFYVRDPRAKTSSSAWEVT
ncbi:uncharacterized protein LOC135196329 isoform X2 [Macrobrachium nipponense]|uniref:uncharacterized protein LOC135196329 isoform X2 n=1 Tax=Macrobrachium nipponense TaxID=159736 RepID=UPI0030C7B792